MRCESSRTWILALALTLAFPLASRAAPDLEASASRPAGARVDYEIQVSLEFDGGERLDFEVPLTRRQYDEARFAPREYLEAAVDLARRRLARKRSYFRQVYGEDAPQLEPSRVREATLVDHRRRQRDSLLPVRGRGPGA